MAETFFPYTVSLGFSWLIPAWVHAVFAAFKENSHSVAFKDTEAARRGLDRLNRAILQRLRY